jgi:hypothetical protein
MVDDDADAWCDGLTLAMRMESQLQGAQSTTVVFACTWLLAGLIMQAREDGHTIDSSLEVIMRQIRGNLAQLMSTEPTDKTILH